MTLSTSPAELPVIDEHEALGQCLGRVDLLRRVLAACAGNLPRLGAALTAGLDAADRTDLRKVVHTIRGAAGNISARRVFDSAQALEEVLLRGDEQQVRERADQLEREMLILEHVLAGILERTEWTIGREAGH